MKWILTKSPPAAPIFLLCSIRFSERTPNAEGYSVDLRDSDSVIAGSASRREPILKGPWAGNIAALDAVITLSKSLLY